MISGRQMKAARALRVMDQSMLANLAGNSVTALVSIEREASTPRNSNLEAIQKAPETAGVTCNMDQGSGPGVRLRN